MEKGPRLPLEPLFPPKTFSPVRSDGPRRCLRGQSIRHRTGSPQPRQPDGRRREDHRFSQQKRTPHVASFFIVFWGGPNCATVCRSSWPFPSHEKTIISPRPTCRPFFHPPRGRTHEESPPWSGGPSLIRTKVFGRDGGSLRGEGATFFQKGPPSPLKKQPPP